MKTLQTALLASTFLCVTYVAVPGPARADSPGTPQVNFEPTFEEKKTNDDTDVAIELARNGFPVRSEAEELKDSSDAEELSFFHVPDACVIQTLLQQELGDLVTRARAFRAHEEEVRQAQFQIVLGRYERAILAIQAAWKAGEVAEDIALKTMYTMRADAFDYLQTLGVTDIRARLEEALVDMVSRGQDAMARGRAAHDTFRKLYELRLESALAVLQKRLADANLTKLDFQRISDAIRALENLAQYGKPYECES